MASAATWVGLDIILLSEAHMFTCIYVCVYVYIHRDITLPAKVRLVQAMVFVDEHLDCLQVLAIVNSTSENIGGALSF